MKAEALARLWHKTSARLAFRHGVPSRMVSWDELPQANRRHLLATAAEVLVSEPMASLIDVATCAADEHGCNLDGLLAAREPA